MNDEGERALFRQARCLVGLGEIARELGLSRASVYPRTDYRDVPEPTAYTGSRPVVTTLTVSPPRGIFV